MKKTLAASLGLIVFLAGGYFAYSQKPLPAKVKTPEGWWILSDYQDPMLSQKAIGSLPHSGISDKAILVHVSADTIRLFGSIFENTFALRISEGDTIFRIAAESEIKFTWDSLHNKISAYWVRPGKTVLRKANYRHLRKNEESLTEGLIPYDGKFRFEKNYAAFIHATLFAGTYQSVENPQTHLVLSSDQTMNGYGKWNRYLVDDFFGTSHWTGKLDRIRFEDTTNTEKDYKLYNSDKGPYRDYNWSFSGDTLILLPFVGYDIELYTLGKKELKFVKENQ